MPVPLRKYSQNWLANDELALSLVRAIGPRPNERFLEIGPGEGRLTRALLSHPVEVTAVEIDRRCCDLLHAIAADLPNPEARLTVMETDVLELDYGSLGSAGRRFVGNLPYAIASPILRWTVKHHRSVIDAHYMLPADIAARLTAPPGDPQRGLISVVVGWFFEGAVVRRLGPGAFRPSPKIESAFLRLKRVPPPVCGAPCHHRRAVVNAAFAHRRKTVANGLRLGGWTGERVDAALRAAEVPAGARAESLDVRQFARLADELPEIE